MAPYRNASMPATWTQSSPPSPALTSPECLAKSIVRPLLQEIVKPSVTSAVNVTLIVFLISQDDLKNLVKGNTKEVAE